MPEFHHTGTDQRAISTDPAVVPSSIDGFVLRPTRSLPKKRQKVSTFNIIAALFILAAGVVLYVSNVIAVNRLSMEINALQLRYGQILNENEILKAEYNRKSALDRIGKIAVEELGLQHPKDTPLWLKIEDKKLENIEGSKNTP